MNLSEFCSDYRDATKRLEAALQHSLAGELRENLGYSLEQVLLERARAVQQAVAERNDTALRGIGAIDEALVALGGRVIEHLGVDVRRFLNLSRNAQAATAGGYGS